MDAFRWVGNWACDCYQDWYAQFRELLAGAYAMDQHFASAKFSQNMPVLLGLIGVWNSTFLGINAHAVLPYDGRLSFFPQLFNPTGDGE